MKVLLGPPFVFFTAPVLVILGRLGVAVVVVGAGGVVAGRVFRGKRS